MKKSKIQKIINMQKVVDIEKKITQYLNNFPLMPMGDKKRVLENAMSVAKTYINDENINFVMKRFNDVIMELVEKMVTITYNSTKELYDDMKTYNEFCKNHHKIRYTAKGLTEAYMKEFGYAKFDMDMLMCIATKIIAEVPHDISDDTTHNTTHDISLMEKFLEWNNENYKELQENPKELQGRNLIIPKELISSAERCYSIKLNNADMISYIKADMISDLTMIGDGYILSVRKLTM